MLSEANFLILDEPTNHLDITSKEILEEALNNYSGTVLYVSHDRYFINQTCSRILELCQSDFCKLYQETMTDYLEKKEELTRAYASATAVSAGIAPSESSSDQSDRIQIELAGAERTAGKRAETQKRSEKDRRRNCKAGRTKYRNR